MTTAPKGGRGEDKFDFAIINLEPELASALDDARFVREDELYVGDLETRGRAYMALGYPNSKNRKIDHTKRSIKPLPFSYGANVLDDPAFANRLGVTGNDHFFVKYEKRSRELSGTVVNSIAPHGMSGGALIDLGRFSNPLYLTGRAPDNFLLAGLLIEYHKKQQRMLSVRIDTVLGVLENETTSPREGRSKEESA